MLNCRLNQVVRQGIGKTVLDFGLYTKKVLLMCDRPKLKKDTSPTSIIFFHQNRSHSHKTSRAFFLLLIFMIPKQPEPKKRPYSSRTQTATTRGEEQRCQTPFALCDPIKTNMHSSAAFLLVLLSVVAHHSMAVDGRRRRLPFVHVPRTGDGSKTARIGATLPVNMPPHETKQTSTIGSVHSIKPALDSFFPGCQQQDAQQLGALYVKTHLFRM